MTTILYHADNDGFGAAYAAWGVFGDTATYIPVQHNQPVPEIPERTKHLFILDFSYDRATCEALAEKYDLRILDHHKTAQAALDGLSCVTFDRTKSGARLAWEYFHLGTDLPDILQYVEDYDLWKFALPDSRLVNLYISSLPWDFAAWAEFRLYEALPAGKAIMAFRQNQLDAALKNVRMMRWEIEGQTYNVPVVNASANVSELGNELCVAYPDAPFSASYCDRKDCRSWSLRSVGEFDVSAIAKQFGGGGHRNAAGFSTDLFWPQMYTEEFLKAFEGA